MIERQLQQMVRLIDDLLDLSRVSRGTIELRRERVALGSIVHNAVETTVYLAHFNDFPAMNEVYAEYFGDSPPARSTLQVGSLPRGMLVQISCIAIIPWSVGSITLIEARESKSSFNLDFDSDI